MEMTKAERKIWLSEIERIHREQRRLREEEIKAQLEQIENFRNRETG